MFISDILNKIFVIYISKKIQIIRYDLYCLPDFNLYVKLQHLKENGEVRRGIQAAGGHWLGHLLVSCYLPSQPAEENREDTEK